MTILQMSIQAGLLIVAIVIVRALALNNLPKASFLILWGVALVRMLLPFSFSSKWSIYSIADGLASKPIMRDIANDTFLTMNGLSQSKEPLEGITGQGTAMTISPVTMVWLCIMALLAIFFIIRLGMSLRELRFSTPIKDNPFIDEWTFAHKLRRHLKIMESDRISTPLAIGILCPRIIFPKTMDMDNKQLVRHILTHEYYHIRRFDMLWKLIALCAVCVHWFNPMAWVMLILFNRDLEITCDEMAVKNLGGDVNARKAYAYSIIAMAETRGRYSPLNSYFSKNAAEERITSIMKHKKASVLTIIIAVVLVVGLTTAFASSKTKPAVQAANEIEVCGISYTALEYGIESLGYAVDVDKTDIEEEVKGDGPTTQYTYTASKGTDIVGELSVNIYNNTVGATMGDQIFYNLNPNHIPNYIVWQNGTAYIMTELLANLTDN